jgi:hypothetical protein
MAFGILLVLSCWAWQLFMFLKSGSWHGVGALDFYRLFHNTAWAYEPHDWIGLHKVLNWINGGLAGACIFLAVGAPLWNYER